jgi:hypothetical protein
MPKSTSISNSILALLLNATPWANIADNAAASPVTQTYLALHTASLTGADTQATSETSYTNYARVAVPRSISGWTAPSAGASSNVAAVDFPSCGVTGATITTASLGKQASGAGIVYYYGDLNAPIAVSNAIQPRFAIGAVTITES